MTLKRISSISCLLFVLALRLSAQSSPTMSGASQLDQNQLMALDSLAADTTAGEIVMPNVFSPNNDGSLDVIDVPTDGTTMYEFIIFSRTGTRVYHSHSPRIFWDGRTDGGMEVKPGVYYYVLEEQGGSDPLQKAGFIYLYR